MFARYSKKDGLIAGVLVIVMLLVAGMQLTRGVPYWGDDFAAYLSEGIAISEGTLEAQAALNAGMHPSPLPKEARGERLVYAWGFPLALSAVHKMVGFDLTDYSSVMYYKLPSLLAFGLMAGVLYLFYRRRFSAALSVFLTLIFCACETMITVIDWLYSDTFFLFFCVLSFWLAECLTEAIEKPGQRWNVFFGAVMLGISFFATYETRLNGLTVILIIAAAQILRIIKQREKYRRQGIVLLALPYVIFLGGKIISEQLLLPATSNMSDVGSASFMKIVQNVGYYFGQTFEYAFKLSRPVSYVLAPLFLLMMLVGIWAKGFKWENLHMTVFVIATYAILIVLPYVQGVRYFFNILPFMVLYSAYGGQVLYEKWQQRKPLKHAKKWMAGAAAVMLLCSYGTLLFAGVQNLSRDRRPEKDDVYSKEAVEAYQYIRQHTNKDDVIACIKPRALYLNTDRRTIRPGVNGHTVDEADYFLHVKAETGDGTGAETMLQYAADAQEMVFENESFTLWKMKE